VVASSRTKRCHGFIIAGINYGTGRKNAINKGNLSINGSCHLLFVISAAQYTPYTQLPAASSLAVSHKYHSSSRGIFRGTQYG
jgi:hypothetical protein